MHRDHPRVLAPVLPPQVLADFDRTRLFALLEHAAMYLVGILLWALLIYVAFTQALPN